MPLSFDLKHAIYGAAGAAVGVIMGYLFGFMLYIEVLSASAFGPSSSAVSTMATDSGLFLVTFAVAFGALGFFSGYYISTKSEETKPSSKNEETRFVKVLRKDYTIKTVNVNPNSFDGIKIEIDGVKYNISEQSFFEETEGLLFKKRIKVAIVLEGEPYSITWKKPDYSLDKTKIYRSTMNETKHSVDEFAERTEKH